ncbi:MAG: Uma2 family endonuclease [Microcoleus vaginatus WJT46-NPBG5]|jgi:Uma2 family endonuclease|nr:Uma2 family endonuclease [Microcoleus vaginatus WJT46-NPBG5]
MLSSIKSQSKLFLEDFLQLLETKPASEYIAGSKIYQKPMPQGKHSIIQGSLLTAINQIGQPQQLLCAFPEFRLTTRWMGV